MSGVAFGNDKVLVRKALSCLNDGVSQPKACEQKRIRICTVVLVRVDKTFRLSKRIVRGVQAHVPFFCRRHTIFCSQHAPKRTEIRLMCSSSMGRKMRNVRVKKFCKFGKARLKQADIFIPN